MIIAKKKYRYKGKLYSATGLAKLVNVNSQTIRSRIEKMKWSVKKAVETPAREGRTPAYQISFGQVNKAINNWKDITEAACILFYKKHNLPRKMKWCKVRQDIEEMRRMKIAA